MFTKEESCIYQLFKLKFDEEWAKHAAGITLRSMRQFLLQKLEIVERELVKFDN